MGGEGGSFHSHGGEFSQGLAQLDSGVERRMTEEEAEQEDAYISKQEQEEAAKADLFKDPKNNFEKYDPKTKFGVIEGEGQLLYDDITTSYKLNLPVDYYHK